VTPERPIGQRQFKADFRGLDFNHIIQDFFIAIAPVSPGWAATQKRVCGGIRVRYVTSAQRQIDILAFQHTEQVRTTPDKRWSTSCRYQRVMGYKYARFILRRGPKLIVGKSDLTLPHNTHAHSHGRGN
jgi:hypothetical protein